MPELLLFLILFATGFVAGLVDSIAGGGGLITIPVLLGIGIPPQIALGTNKLQASFGSGSAMLTFIRSRAVKLSDCTAGIIYTAFGSAFGSYAVQLLDPTFLKLTIPWLLLAIVVYSVLMPSLGQDDIQPRMTPGVFFFFAGLTLGFYDGFFGPGTGSFWVVLLMIGLGFNMTKATAHTKVMNFTSNFISLLIFATGGAILWREGLIMGCGQFLGARVGSRLVIRKGTTFIRPVFLTMVLLITAKLLWQNYH
jgi:uncharacterized membrane protein YfcA